MRSFTFLKKASSQSRYSVISLFWASRLSSPVFGGGKKNIYPHWKAASQIIE
jgi:hypothetical protein